MNIISGKEIANLIKQEIKLDIQNLKKQYNEEPKLVIIQVGDNPSSNVYIKNKLKLSEEIGSITELFKLPESSSKEEILNLISKCNLDKSIHGILVQLPLPKHINEQCVLEAIDKNKDVDCFNPYNIGKL